MDVGVAYIATGEEYVQEARISAESCKSHNDEVNITLLTDRDINFDVFDNILVREEMDHNYGLIPPDFFPYERTLFLNTDTKIYGDITELFELLDKYDMAISESPGLPKDVLADFSKIEGGIPSAFPLFNSGVVVYKSNQNVQELFSKWHSLYHNYKEYNGFPMNQPSLRIALYQIDINFVPLSNKYNCRVPYHGAVNGKVKILHGRSAGSTQRLDQIEDRINQTNSRRVYTLEQFPIRVHPESEALRFSLINNIHRLRHSIYQNGIIRGGVKPVKKYIKRALADFLK